MVMNLQALATIDLSHGELAQSIQSFASDLDAKERYELKSILSLAAEKLAEPIFEGKSFTADDKKTFDALQDCIRACYGAPEGVEIPENGILFHGRPDFMTDELLLALGEEATLRRSDAENVKDILFESQGREVSLRYRELLADFVKARVPYESNGFNPKYFYYEHQVETHKPHLDQDTFSLNVLCMLDHAYEESDCSCLVLCPKGLEPIRVDILPGQILCFFGGCTIHYREPIHHGETVRLITCGFHPEGISGNPYDCSIANTTSDS